MRFFIFNGRAGRLEYLGIAIAALVVHTINGMLFLDMDSFRAGGTFVSSPLYLVAFALATWTTWCAAIRRCHDLGRSGFFLLWQVVPLLGIAAMLFVVFARGDDMKNQFGLPPWSVTNRAEKRAEIERAAVLGAIADQAKPDEDWATNDGKFDMDGLWDSSDISR